MLRGTHASKQKPARARLDTLGRHWVLLGLSLLGCGTHGATAEPPRAPSPPALGQPVAGAPQRDCPRVQAMNRVAEGDQSASYWYKLGLALSQQAEAGDRASYELAKTPLRRCLEKESRFAECHYLLGVAYQFTDDPQAALAAYSHAIELDPARAFFYPDLADLYLTLKLPAQAEAVLKEGLRVTPSSPLNDPKLYDMYLLSAKIAQFRGDSTAQLSALEQAAPYAGSSHPEYSFSLGVTYATMNPPRKKEAVQALMLFYKLVCKGAAAAQFKLECEASSSFLQRLTP